jgi:hypothetical protein
VLRGAPADAHCTLYSTHLHRMHIKKHTSQVRDSHRVAAVPEVKGIGHRRDPVPIVATVAPKQPQPQQHRAPCRSRGRRRCQAKERPGSIRRDSIDQLGTLGAQHVSSQVELRRFSRQPSAVGLVQAVHDGHRAACQASRRACSAAAGWLHVVRVEQVQRLCHRFLGPEETTARLQIVVNEMPHVRGPSFFTSSQQSVK